MKRITVITFKDSNLSGFSWSWDFFVTRRSDNSFSVSAKQSVEDPPAMRIPCVHPLRDSAEIMSALENMVEDAGYSIAEEDKPNIKKQISKLGNG